MADAGQLRLARIDEWRKSAKKAPVPLTELMHLLGMTEPDWLLIYFAKSYTRGYDYVIIPTDEGARDGSSIWVTMQVALNSIVNRMQDTRLTDEERAIAEHAYKFFTLHSN